MIAIEALEKQLVDLSEHGYHTELRIDLVKKVAMLRCNIRDEDIATLARRILGEKKSQQSSSRKVRPF